MYDFRQDVKDLIDLTDNTPQSLKQTAKSLMIIGCAFLENEQLNDSVKLVKNKVVADKAKPDKLKTKNTNFQNFFALFSRTVQRFLTKVSM